MQSQVHLSLLISPKQQSHIQFENGKKKSLSNDRDSRGTSIKLFLFWLFIIFQMIPPKLVLSNRSTQQLYQHLLEVQPLAPQRQTVYNKGARRQAIKMKSRPKKKNIGKKIDLLGSRTVTPLFAKTEGWTVESSGSKERSQTFSSPRNFDKAKYFKSNKFSSQSRDKINIEDDSFFTPTYKAIHFPRRPVANRFGTPRTRLFTEEQLDAIHKSIQLEPVFQQSNKTIYISSRMQVISPFIVDRKWISVVEDPFKAQVAFFSSKQEFFKAIGKKHDQSRDKPSLANYLPINDSEIITALFLMTEGQHLPSMMELSSLLDQSSLGVIFEANSFWVLKPRANANHSNSFILGGKEELLEGLRGLSKKNKLKQFMVQKYITSIYLYEKRKFSMKQILLITQINGVFKGFLCEELIIETASLEFTPANRNPCAHFTDYQLQRQSKSYSKYEQNNLLTPKELADYLLKGNPKISFSDVRADMKDISISFTKAVYSLMQMQTEKQNSFQIFEVSYILREDGKPVLTDLNSEPNIKPKHLRKLWQKCLQNIVSLTVDVLMAPPASYFSQHRPELQSRCFQMIFDSRINDYRQQRTT